ncbi:MAG: hypothetical protein KDA92_01465, partial [Planctomycetales bacterium]|nr:hypothetical protein [Planctomycetales bacterium]
VSQLRLGPRDFDDTKLLIEATPAKVVVQTPEQGFLGGNLELELIQRELITGHITALPVAAVARIAGLDERIDGVVNCELSAALTADLSAMTASLTVDSPAISLRDASLKQLHATLQMRDGLASAVVTGATLGGSLSLQANADVERLVQLKPADLSVISDLPVDALATVQGIRMQEAWPIIGQQDQLRPLRGTLSATFERGAAEQAAGNIAVGQVSIHDMRWNNELWSNQIRADIELSDRLAEVRRVSGQFAGGRINGRGKVTLDDSRNGSFEFSANRVSLSRALVPLASRGELADGMVSMRITGRLGNHPSGRAIVLMDRGTAGPIALANVRVPIDWSLDPRASTVQWSTTNASIELGGGRVVTNAKGRWNGKLDMNMMASARRVDTSRILAARTSPGTGYLDGTVRLNARQALSANDFNGVFDATLTDSSSLQFPVISDLTKFLKTVPSTTSFDESRAQGRFGNGMVHLDRVTLAAANVQVLAEGTATLQGRLNLEVMARTGETGPADKLLELADSPLLAAAPTPVALVAKANTALKDRVVHLRIGGTATSPMIRLEPGRQIGQDAIKFFVNQAIAFRDKNDELSFR